LIRINLIGPGVGVISTVMDLLLLATLCVIWINLVRSRGDAREDMLRYAAGTVATLLVLGTVLSPQYVVWLIPLVPLVGGRRGTAAILSFVVVAALTGYWFPSRYFEYQGKLAADTAGILLVRNLALLGLALILLLPDRIVARTLCAPILRCGADRSCGTAGGVRRHSRDAQPAGSDATVGQDGAGRPLQASLGASFHRKTSFFPK
jgi:hypothetical protein